MIEKCSIGKMSNSLQNISLIILILILIIVILFYIRNSSLKHNELIEKYTTTGFLNQTPDISYSGSLTATNNTSMFPSQGTVVTLRTCQVNFNNDGTSKYEYQDEWKEILRVNGEANDIPVKTIGYDNTTNVDTFGHNFSERSRCFKELDETNTETYKYKYLDNDLIQYDRNNYVSLTSNINGADVTKKYMEMKFNILGSSYENLFNNTSNSICSLNYSTSLSGTDLGNVKLYRLKLTTDNKIENIEKININPTNNHIFTNVADIDLNSLLTTTNTSSYVYENGKFIFRVISNVTGGTAGGVNNINVNIYNFDRELFCNKDQEGVTYNNIKSYKIFSNKQLDVNKLISASSANTDTNIPDTIFPNANTTSYDKKTSVLSHIKEVLKTQIKLANDPALTAETTAQKNIEEAEQRRDSFVSSINTKSKFIYKILTETDATILHHLNRNNFITLDKLSYSSKNITDQENLIDSVSEPVFSQVIRDNTINEDINEEIDIYTVETFTDTTKLYTKQFLKETICDILIVGGGGGGDREIGGGGGGGAVLYTTKVKIPSGTYQIKVGKGGAQNEKGSSSEAFGAICLGGGSTEYQAWSTGNSGTSGGSGSGGSANAPITAINNVNGGGIGTSTKGTLLASGTLYNGNVGGKATSDNLHHAGGGGGGAGMSGNNSIANGNSNTTRQSYIDSGYPQKGGDGVPINITGTTYYWGAGGGGGSYNTHGGDGGLGGGGGGGATFQLAGLAGTGGLNNGGGGVGQRNGSAPYEVGGFGAPNTGSGGGGGGYFGIASGGNGGSGIVIIRYKNEPIQIGNEKQITLKHNNKINLIFTYRTDEPSYSWQEAYDEAIKNGRRMPTITELRDYIDNNPSVFDIFNGMDVWIPVVNPEIKTGRHAGKDWVQAGNLYHVRKKSHTDYYAYPTWGDNTTEDYAKVYFEVEHRYIQLQNKYRVKINRSTRVKINNTQSYTLFDRGTYDIIMGNTETQIVNTSNPSIVIGTYTNINENEMKFTYSINKTLNELNRETTVFGSTIPSIKNSTNYYSLGNKTINTIVKYKININRIHTIDNHVLRVYVQNGSGSLDEIVGDDRIIEKISDETNVTIILTTYYITINKNISGNIFLTSEKQIFYVEESGRNEFNSFTESKFTTDINNMLINNDDLAELNIQFGVTEETKNKNTATGQLINLNDSTNPISISYNKSIINNDSKNSLNTLITTYNNVYSFDESNVSGQLQPIKNIHNFGNVLSPITTMIDEYISYELPTEKVPQTRKNLSFNIKNTATKYIYFIKN